MKTDKWIKFLDLALLIIKEILFTIGVIAFVIAMIEAINKNYLEAIFYLLVAIYFKQKK